MWNMRNFLDMLMNLNPMYKSYNYCLVVTDGIHEFQYFRNETMDNIPYDKTYKGSLSAVAVSGLSSSGLKIVREDGESDILTARTDILITIEVEEFPT